MTALTTLGILCIILVCFGPATDLIVDIYRKPKPTQIDKDGKRELKINRISYWDYLILILPAILLLIGLISKNQQERTTSFTILGIGYMFLVLSPYNRRIDISKINWFLFSTCLTLALIGYLLGQNLNDFILQSESRSYTTLYFPALAYIFLQASRQVIKLFTGTYPVTLDKYYRVGTFHSRYNRKTNYWDMIWSLISAFGFPTLMICMNL
ncbi:MAG: hypothetical protein IM574_06615 [Cytophagales bacterium]|jgi:uncharacterized membrane protein YfcA|uniref:hypothetical protein n=1 Tax=Microcystis sp. M135S2 TaxID=2771144 RepID=UPI002586D29F|nr:hypothetical protein [Microcystis sp. M135S2]MCA6413346.1 hypothetical protein [Cytophagales bacterium]MCA6437046.1 hypothetical protein [Bacteroidota bacterium]MCA6493020.1 hypothetical protein [Chitinophagaceae bacterium]MCA2774323.1 hypothetical protein [Microcystis sp. M135S2]MCA6415923.1 hypothetical protein [Cytophagales bacterium]